MSAKSSAEILADIAAPYTESKLTDALRSVVTSYEYHPIVSGSLPITATTSRTKFTALDSPTVSRGVFTDVDIYNTSTQKITPEFVGAAYLLRIDITAASTTNSNNDLLIELDIGGAAGVIASRSIYRRSSASFSTNAAFPVFCEATFVANGGEFYITASTADFTITGGGLAIFRL